MVVLWGSLRLCCYFIFGLIRILNIRDQFSCVLLGFSFSLVSKPCVVTCVLLEGNKMLSKQNSSVSHLLCTWFRSYKS